MHRSGWTEEKGDRLTEDKGRQDDDGGEASTSQSAAENGRAKVVLDELFGSLVSISSQHRRGLELL